MGRSEWVGVVLDLGCKEGEGVGEDELGFF